MRAFSLFSGIGGFDLALERNNIEIIGHSEIDKYADQIYSKHFNNKNYGDITKINPKNLPQFDLLVGGFPCQSFSIAGKRRGFRDTRGTLFFEIVRIIREKQPRILLLENVKGLLSHDKGSTFFKIISALDELGYDCQWQVLNSKNFGVPQNRERVFIVGHLRGTSRPEIFPITGKNKKDIRNVGEDLCYCLDANYHKGTNTLSKNRRQLILIPEATKKGYAEARVGDSINLSVPNSKTRRGRVGNKVAQTIDTGMQQYTICKPVLTPDRIKKRQRGRRMKENGDPSFTLTSQDKHGIYDGVSIRRLTPKECERLQGFPDHWTEGISDTQRYKCLGNAVTVNVVDYILNKLLWGN